MDIIGKAFNPAGGAAKAVCEKVDGCIRGQIIKGDGPDSPSLVFNRELHLNDDGIWGKCIHKNSGRQLGTWPESPYTLKADYIALSAEFMTVRPEIYVARDLLCKDHFNLYLGKDAVLLSSAPYERERDWEKLNEAILGAFRAMCGDNPEEHWDDAGKVLRDTLGPDNAYVLIVDADECRKRLNWNTPEGPETDIRLKISWSKKGWALMNSEWDERREDIVQAITENTVTVFNNLEDSLLVKKKMSSIEDKTMIYMTMRLNRRIIQNAMSCKDQIRQHRQLNKYTSSNYRWMLMQPFIAIDQTSMAVMIENQITDMKEIARELPMLLMELLAIKAPDTDTHTGALSGGNQQKVVVAKQLAAEPQVIILDEPTKGVDVGSKAAIYEIMSDLASQGLGILMISSELPEVINMSDRIYVMSEGKVAKEFTDTKSLTQDDILHAAMPQSK